MEHQIRTFVNHKRKLAFVSSNIDGMAAHSSTVALRRFHEAFPELDINDIETDKYMITSESKFQAFSDMREALRQRGFKILSQCEE
ncbi:hypothetical protein phiAS5_ORF0170 [Aeromonas phage phiAS5]|uniref:Uncharacterized protein n=1 Tax=Aeromonas phage phiAS5 TaxID=879630 RepID=E1A2R7_9CAUD|nr:hypothetical protein phiAS5_ORF0170 [Aeromonas phage phiAS5]ADM80013.1 hypothetical protein phiAS5_ORF0170 [Aeromonas phage phiAS5]